MSSSPPNPSQASEPSGFRRDPALEGDPMADDNAVPSSRIPSTSSSSDSSNPTSGTDPAQVWLQSSDVCSSDSCSIAQLETDYDAANVHPASKIVSIIADALRKAEARHSKAHSELEMAKRAIRKIASSPPAEALDCVRRARETRDVYALSGIVSPAGNTPMDGRLQTLSGDPPDGCTVERKDSGINAIDDSAPAGDDGRRISTSPESTCDSVSVSVSASTPHSHSEQKYELFDNGIRQTKKYNQAICLNIAAGLVSFILLAVALSFLISAFVRAQRHPFLQAKYTNSSELQVPIVTICARFPDVHTFYKGAGAVDKRFTGLPIVTLTRYEHVQSGEEISYPDTEKLLDERVLGANRTYCERRLSVMDSRRFSDGIGLGPRVAPDRCSSCLRLGFKKNITLRADKASNTLNFAGVRLDFAISGLFSFCRFERDRTQNGVLGLFAKELYSRKDDLLRTGVISDPEGKANFSNPNVFGWPTLQIHPDLEGDSNNFAVDFYCNVYFFSGIYYPTANNDVGFVYNSTLRFWNRNPLKKGPFLNSFPREAQGTGVGEALKRLRKPSNDTLVSWLSVVSLDVYMEDIKEVDKSPTATVNQTAFVGTVDANRDASFKVRISQSVLGRREIVVTSRVDNHRLPPPNFPKPSSQSRIELDFSRYFVESLDTTRNFPVALFVADLLNYISLFTGLSFYTLVVAPIHIFMSRRAFQIQRFTGSGDMFPG